MYIIGDVHGCYNTLCKLIEQLPKKYNEKICVVGNIIDFGPKSKQVLELIIDNNYDCVLGNHEYGFLYEIEKYLLDIENNCFNFNNTEWYKNMGGIKTLSNYHIPYLLEDSVLLKKHISFLESLPIYKEYFGLIPNQTLVVSNGYIGDFWENRKYVRTLNQKNKFRDSVIWNQNLNKVNRNIFNVFGNKITKDPDLTKFYCNLNTDILSKKGYLSAIHIPSLKIYKQKLVDRVI